MSEGLREIAVVSYAGLPVVGAGADPAIMVQAVVSRVLEDSGLDRSQLGFVCSGSRDYDFGQPFAFVSALDGVGAWPPVAESHVEMDGAWALYEAWVKLLTGDIDAALVYAFGCASRGDLDAVQTLELNPYTLAPLGVRPAGLAALQARSLIDAGRYTEADFARVAARGTDQSADELLRAPYVASPLRAHDRAPRTDGAVAVLLAAGDLARELCERPAWIRGMDHRIEVHSPGFRDLTRAPSIAEAGRRARGERPQPDLAELHAPWSHQAFLIRDALALEDGTAINPSGRVLAREIPMAAGLQRIGEAAARLSRGDADTALAHATMGPCLQQNLVCYLSAEEEI